MTPFSGAQAERYLSWWFWSAYRFTERLDLDYGSMLN